MYDSSTSYVVYYSKSCFTINFTEKKITKNVNIVVNITDDHHKVTGERVNKFRMYSTYVYK